MISVLEQLKKRRKALGLKQKDLSAHVGMSRQQYQRLETQGNPRLSTLELIAKGLRGELVFVPQDKLRLVQEVVNERASVLMEDSGARTGTEESSGVADDPWAGLLEDSE